jgi:hypothetical protein
VAAYTANNHACLRHKRFTDNDHDQQTYGSDPKKFRKRTQIFFPQCKNDQCGSKNTALVEKQQIPIVKSSQSTLLKASTDAVLIRWELP